MSVSRSLRVGDRAANDSAPSSSDSGIRDVSRERHSIRGYDGSEILAGVSRDSAVSTEVVHTLFDYLETVGVSRLQLLRASDLEHDRLQLVDGRVPRAIIYRLCEVAMDLTDDPALGLHWAERFSEHAFPPLSSLIAHAATLREAFDSLAQFSRLVMDECSCELLECNDSVIVRTAHLVGESPRVHRFTSEVFMTRIFELIRSFRVHPRSVQVNFEHAAPPYHSEYARVFGETARFKQSRTSIVFDRAFMDAVSPNKDDDVHSALRSIAQRRMMRLTQRIPYAERVRDLMVQRGPSGRADMETVARLLGLSVRSLRRRLYSERRTYKSVANDAFAIMAKHLLRTTRRTIQEIALDLDFADTSAFHRAFKRQIGMTPQAYRSQQLVCK
jgi:AraC-like DNA-binding protein